MSAGKRVTFHTAMSDSELVDKYREARLTVIPAVMDGGYTTALESMACGTPVVAANVGSLPELVQDGKTGWVTPANDGHALKEKIACLMHNASLAAVMGQAGRERILEQFTWDAVVQQYLHVYATGV